MARYAKRVIAALVICAAMVVLGGTAAGALEENATCLTCHETFGNAVFSLPPVDKATVCDNCHLDGFVGTHPKHQVGGTCNACHPKFGQALMYAVPQVLTEYGAFTSANSPNLPAYTIHTIHASPRWPSAIKTPASACSSCHNTVLCSSCHGDLIDVTHSQHGMNPIEPTSSIGATWTGDVSVGVVASEAEDTVLVGQSVYCGATGCHDTAGIVAEKPGLMDCYTHPADATTGYLATTVTKTGTWSWLAGAVYSKQRETFSNYTGATLNTTFTGERVSIISTIDPYRGIGRVYIDNVDMGTFDQYSATTKYQRVVWTSPNLADPGPHTLRVVITGSKNPSARAAWVGYDHLEVSIAANDTVAAPCVECHAPQGAPTHGNMDHGYTAASAYNNTTQSGCTNSGAGCHGTTETGDAVTGFHTTGKVTCLSSGCHTSATMDAAWKTANSGAECLACHAGNFVNAADRTPLDGPATNGHYSETTHTAAAMDATVIGGTGGTYSATCATCHNPVSATYVDGYFAQHQGLGGGLGDTTCADCHSSTAGTAAVVTDSTRTDSCTPCHNATALPGKAQHSTPVAPAVAGIEANGAGTCATTGCHTSTNLHELHKSNSNATANGCTMMDCHDSTAQGVKPTAKSCGGATADCHTASPVHPNEAAAHTTLASAECVVCHESPDLKTVHADQCNYCHGNSSYPTIPVGKLECTSCHNGTDVGLHVYSPIDFNHYTGTEATHTADAQAGTEGGFTCITCHKMEMRPEHITKSSSAYATATADADKCIVCHELRVDPLGAYPAWNNTCDSCHTPKHSEMATKHDASAVGAACGGASCHTISDVAAIHANSVVQSPVDNPSSCVSACHTDNNTIPTSITCVSAGCHAGGHSHTLEAAQSGGCYDSGAGCHPTSTLDYSADYHPASGCTSGPCHTAANHNDAAFDNPVGCLECHNAQYNNAPDVVPTASVHYVEATHTATAMDTAIVGYTFNNLCTNCHSAAMTPAHATTSIGAIGCTTGGSGDAEGCHNDTDLPATYGQIKTTSWTNDLCSDCHTSSHTTYTLGTHTAAATAGCTLSTGCHGYAGGASEIDVRALHDTRVGVGCTATGADSQGWTGACHALNQSMTTGAMTCGALGTCHSSHTASNHMPVHDANNATSVGCTRTGCHELADKSTDTTSVIDYHSPTIGIGTPISGKVNDGCNICHGGGGWTDVAAQASLNGTNFECVGCHEGVLGDSMSPYDPDHYTGTETTHTASDSTYTYDTGYPAVACSACHKLEMKPEHWKSTTSTTTMAGYVDTCVGCHEVKVDGFGAAWDDTCGACHNGALASHQATATAHDATAVGAGCAGEAATEQTLHSENFDGVTAPAWPATWTKGGTDSALQITASGDASTAPNAAKFASDTNVTAKKAYFEKTFDTTGKTSPRISFDYKTAFPTIVGAPTNVTLRPNGTAANAWTITGDPTAHGAVDEDPHDNDSTYIASTAVQGAAADIDVDTFTLGSGAVNSVTMYAYVRVASGSERLRFRYNNGDGWAGSATNLTVGATYALVSETVPTPAGGWTQAKIDALGTGLYTAAAGGWAAVEYRATQLYIVVNYTPADNAPAAADNYLKAQYSTNGSGGPWTDLMPEVNATTAWTGASAALPQSANLLVRFSSASDDPTRFTLVDNIAVTYTAMASACHEVTNIAAIHNNSAAAVTTADTTLCQTCHVDNDTIPTNKTCMSVGCHTSGHSHPYTAASDYAQSAEVVDSESGCTGSGAGCHGAVGADRDTVTEFHAATAAGCTASDACHTSPTFANAGWKAGTGAECVRCHDGGFVNAIDTTALADVAPAGHYGVATHTVDAAYMANTVNAGGTASGACTDCHATTYRTAHGALSDGFSSSTKGAYLTCQECHGYNAAVATVVTDAVRDNTCADCHTAGVLGASHAAHGNAPALAGTGTTCASSGLNCHNTADLHVIHQDAAGGCTISNGTGSCHAINKDMTSATKTCGETSGGCHNTYNRTTHYGTYTANHTSTTQGALTYTLNGQSPTCASCHGMALNTEHTLSTSSLTGGGATVCEQCHNETGSTTAITGLWAGELCSACHGETGIDAQHLNVAGHNVVNTGCGASGAGCHPTQDLSKAGADKTVNIHNDCATCHDPAGATSWSYGVTSMTYNPLATTCGGASGCHTNAYYSATGPQIHSIGQAGEVNGDDAIHTASGAAMATLVGAYSYNNACSSCHSSTLLTAHASTSLTNDVSCTTGGGNDAEGCHNDTDYPSSAQVKGNWTNDTCADCHTSGTHTTYTLGTHTTIAGGAGADQCSTGACHSFGTSTDVRAIHDAYSTSGCTATGQDSQNGNSGANAACHALNKPMVAGSLGCGQGTTSAIKCHVNHTNTNHGLSTGGKACYQCHGAEYQSAMEDDGGTKTGATNANSVHHVMGGALGDGDIAPNAGAYPTSQTDVYCVSCHSDHNYFNGVASKAGNLRQNIANASGAATASTDYTNSGSYGICVSCHSTIKAKQGMGTEQLNVGSANTPVVAGAGYDLSAHQYTVSSQYGASATFSADCSKCHSDEVTKRWQTSTYKFGTHFSADAGILNALGVFTQDPPKEQACYMCHNTTAAPYGETLSAAAKATQNEFASTGSTHDLAQVACANCHNVHIASAAAPAADPTNTYNAASVNTTAGVNTYCSACHDGGVPAQVVNGTTLVPYAIGAAPNMSANYASSGHGQWVDCRDCHEQHGSGLVHLLGQTVGGQAVASYTDTADQYYCLACHRAGGFAGAANIRQYYPTTAGGTATQADSPVWTRYGHRIKTAGGTATLGSTLPCRTCHNPHGGAASGYMLAVRTQVAAGVDTLIGDAAGELAMSDADQTPANSDNVRKFCFTCHTTSDTSFGWNGSTMAVVPAGAQVLGLSRTGGVLKLPNIGTIPGHKQAETTYSCYVCHGDDFSESNSVNVHNPAAGESRGGIECYVCHTVYQNRMEDSLGSKTGSQSDSSYHHVLGNGATTQGDRYTDPGLTADGTQNVYCLSCHVDHDMFSPLVNVALQRSNNLRNAYSDAAVTAANSDYNATSGGVCLGCHTAELTRDNTDQKPETNSTKTTAITSANYNASPHQYTASSTFSDATTFNADCSKCHDSEIDGGGMEGGKSTSGFQTSTNKFSVHYSANRRILAAMGVTLVDPPTEEETCYACHSVTADGFKSTTDQDWYGMAAMDAASQDIYAKMALGTPSNNYPSSTLNFWNISDGGVTGNQPSGDQSGDTYNGGAWQARLMDPRSPTAVYESYDTNTVAVAAGTQTWRRVRFVSPPVAQTVSVPAATWTVSIYDRESSTNANARLRPYIYVWRADNTTKVQIVAAANFGTEMGTTALPGAVQNMTTAAGAAVTLQPGDKIVVDVAIQTVTVVTGGNYGLTYSWGSNAVGSLTAPTSIVWNAPFPGGPAHKASSYAGIHRTSPTDETQAYLSANKHVECADCHDVHTAQATLHTKGTNAVAATSPLAGASGVDAAYTAGVAGLWTVPSSYSSVAAVTKEYQVCFRCHSSYNTNVTSWGGSGAQAWTNVALEFNPQNGSYHPVYSALPATDPGVTYGSSRLIAGDMRAAGTVTVNGETWTVGGTTLGTTMYCTDCHSGGATPAAYGPHGSAVKWMLAGPNKAWPYTSAANNGKSTGTYRTLTSMNTNIDTTDGLFCRNCHIMSGTVHTTSQHNAEPCVTCHIRVPHGGKAGRLIANIDEAATYPGTMPARLTGDGNGGSADGTTIRGYNKASGKNGSPSAACQVSGCGSHGTIESEPEW